MDALNHSTSCPVCGFDLGFVPADSFEICPSCGIQFGYNDATPGGAEDQRNIYSQWRRRWIDTACPGAALGSHRHRDGTRPSS